jgi:hypothetical protein
MQNDLHPVRSLFGQLGLPSESAAIEQFFSGHRHLRGNLALHGAVFRTSGKPIRNP